MRNNNHSINLIKLDGLLPEMINTIALQLNEEIFTESSGFGFEDVLYDGEYLSAILLKRTPTFITQYELSTGRLIDQEIFLYSKIHWGIDTRHQTLEIIGPLRNARKLISIFTPFLHSSIRISPINLSPDRVIPILIKNNLLIEIQKLTVNHFQYREGVTGRFEMNISNPEAATVILAQYPNEVSKAKLLIQIPEIGSARIAISTEGHLEVFCGENDLFKVMSHFKTVLFANEEGEVHA